MRNRLFPWCALVGCLLAGPWACGSPDAGADAGPDPGSTADAVAAEVDTDPGADGPGGDDAGDLALDAEPADLGPFPWDLGGLPEGCSPASYPTCTVDGKPVDCDLVVFEVLRGEPGLSPRERCGNWCRTHAGPLEADPCADGTAACGACAKVTGFGCDRCCALAPYAPWPDRQVCDADRCTPDACAYDHCLHPQPDWYWDPCEVVNEHGACQGVLSCCFPQVADRCDGDRFCSAPVPAPEVPDGGDNDCDGWTDEGEVPPGCEPSIQPRCDASSLIPCAAAFAMEPDFPGQTPRAWCEAHCTPAGATPREIELSVRLQNCSRDVTVSRLPCDTCCMYPDEVVPGPCDDDPCTDDTCTHAGCTHEPAPWIGGKCSRVNAFGLCRGTLSCDPDLCGGGTFCAADETGVCSAPEPAGEVEDGADNDCDGLTDEPGGVDPCAPENPFRCLYEGREVDCSLVLGSVWDWGGFDGTRAGCEAACAHGGSLAFRVCADAFDVGCGFCIAVEGLECDACCRLPEVRPEPVDFCDNDPCTRDRCEWDRCVHEPREDLGQPCEHATQWGTCTGQWVCSPPGPYEHHNRFECDAPVPVKEVPDGADNDCDGKTDEAA